MIDLQSDKTIDLECKSKLNDVDSDVVFTDTKRTVTFNDEVSIMYIDRIEYQKPDVYDTYFIMDIQEEETTPTPRINCWRTLTRLLYSYYYSIT